MNRIGGVMVSVLAASVVDRPIIVKILENQMIQQGTRKLKGLNRIGLKLATCDRRR